jgi:hypothetical protein
MEAGEEATGVFGRRMTPLSFSGLELNVPEVMLVYIELYVEHMRKYHPTISVTSLWRFGASKGWLLG